MKVNLRRAFRHPILLMRTLSPFSLAHHPSCEQFSPHTIGFRGRRLCIGCFIGFPATFVAFIVLALLTYYSVLRMALYDFLVIGIVIEASAFLLKIVHHSRRVSARVALKVVQATGIAFILFTPLSLGWSITLKVISVLMIWLVLSTIMSGIRMYETGKTCDACEYKGHWSKCPGFKDVVRKLYEAGFVVD